MKGLLLAGGHGTRLRPLTFTSNKHSESLNNENRLEPIDARYVAGFFDGEGSVEFYIGKTTIRRIWLVMVQKNSEILEEISAWLMSEGIKVSRLSPIPRAMTIVIRGAQNVVHMIKLLLPYIRIKRNQAMAVLDYLYDKITVDEFVKIMNQEVTARRRGGMIRTLPNQPWNKSEGRSRAINAHPATKALLRRRTL